jgi:hypothetical protein
MEVPPDVEPPDAQPAASAAAAKRPAIPERARNFMLSSFAKSGEYPTREPFLISEAQPLR